VLQCEITTESCVTAILLPSLSPTSTTSIDIIDHVWSANRICTRAVSGFSSTDIFPFNPDVFTEADFAPSFVTDIEFATEESSPPEQPIHIAVETVPHCASRPRPNLSPETNSIGVDANPSDGETI
jgi:hypothetical protein